MKLQKSCRKHFTTGQCINTVYDGFWTSTTATTIHINISPFFHIIFSWSLKEIYLALFVMKCQLGRNK